MSLKSDKEKYPRLDRLYLKSEYGYAVSYSDPLTERPMLYSIDYVVEKEKNLYVRQVIADTDYNTIMEKLKGVLNELNG